MPVRPSGDGGRGGVGGGGRGEEAKGREGGVARIWLAGAGGGGGDVGATLPPQRPKNLAKFAEEFFGNKASHRPPSEISWKSRFEDADRKRKQLMALAQKGNSDIESLKESYRKLKEQYEDVCQKSKEKDEKIEKIKKASAAMYQEYEKLNNQYNEETGAYQKAMKHATSWYKENQELKRRSVALAQRFMNESPEITLDMLADEMKMSSISSQENEELEDLKKSVKDLSETVGRLQSELNSARLEEFEAQEAAAALSGELEDSIRACRLAEMESKNAREEIAALRKALEESEQQAKSERCRADAALRDRNTMAHQSALLLSQALEEDYEGKVAAALMEIESLKSQLEGERIAHIRQIKEMEEKLEEKDAEMRLELVEEQLKETRCRADDAERKLSVFEQRVKELECDLDKMEKSGMETLSPLSPLVLPPPPPPPLPPPPPPLPIIPPPPLFASEKSSIQTDKTDACTDETGAVELGKNKQATPTQAAPVLDDIINQIKGGRFTLRNTEKRQLKYIGKADEADNKPPAVKEMLGILGTLRKRPSLASLRNGLGECPQSRNGLN